MSNLGPPSSFELGHWIRNPVPQSLDHWVYILTLQNNQSFPFKKNPKNIFGPKNQVNFLFSSIIEGARTEIATKLHQYF